jgi:CHASE3 domain sensor protein
MNLDFLLKNKVAVGLVLSYLFVIVAASVVNKQIDTVMQDSRELRHSHEVLNNVQNVFVDMLDAETGYRGYVITGDTASLQPYLYAESAISADMNRLLAVTKYDTSEYNNTLMLQRLVQRKLQHAHEIIAMRMHHGLDATIVNIKQAKR